MTISFFVQGTPKAQPRPHAFARKMGDKFVARVYDPGTAEEWKSLIAVAARPHMPAVPIASPVSLKLYFTFPRPQSHFRRDGSLKPEKASGMPPLLVDKKPDLDNCEKAVMDCLTRLGFWRDDSLVCHKDTCKIYCGYGFPAGCRITISTIMPSSVIPSSQYFLLEPETPRSKVSGPSQPAKNPPIQNANSVRSTPLPF